MNRLLLVFIFIFSITTAYAQRYSQYNTGTLYDSFENPAQRSFIPDSSRMYASNFLIPNFNTYALLTGNAQSTLLHRAFFSNYRVTDARLIAGSGTSNHAVASANSYALMFKVFTSLNGDQELGFSAQSRAEGRGVTTDQLVSLVSGTGTFENNHVYENALNSKIYYQAYHQFSLSYRERVSKQFAIGFKLSALLGIAYKKWDITQSALSFSSENNINMYLAGKMLSNYIPGQSTGHDLVPNFRNPGAAISIGTMFRTHDGFVLQWNVKDLGFVHWSKASQTYIFNNVTSASLNTGTSRDDQIYQAFKGVIQDAPVTASFTTPLHGRAEVSAGRTFYLSDDKEITYFPTLIAAKQFYDHGMEGALVNHLRYHNTVFTLTGIYNDLRTFSLGTQLMYKTPNVDFYIGSDALLQTITTARQAGKNEDLVNRYAPYSAASVFLGFSLKFGSFIEHPMNASTIPMGEKGFFARLYGRLFKVKSN